MIQSVGTVAKDFGLVWQTLRIGSRRHRQTSLTALTPRLSRRCRWCCRGKRMVVVLDNARYHHAVLLTPFLRKYRGILKLLFLPPYNPQLAPIERVWKLARRIATHNRYFATLAEVIDAIEACFDRWRKANPVLRRLCGII